MVDKDKLVRLYQQGKTLKQVGSILGISGERVRQLLLTKGVKTRSSGHYKKLPKPNCKKCGEPCKFRKSSYCSRACLITDTKLLPTTLTCDGCGHIFTRSHQRMYIHSWQKSKHTFCSRECYQKNRRACKEVANGSYKRP